MDFYDGEFDFTPEEEKKIKPFNWQQAFPKVFSSSLQGGTTKQSPGGTGGFDVVIGNPPYVRQEMLGEQKTYFQKKYIVFHGMADLYSYFFERGMSLLKKGGLFGIIVANKWMRANYGGPLRKWLKQQSIKEIIDFGDLPVFQGATTYPCIVIASKGHTELVSASFEVTNVKTLQFNSLKEHVQENKIKTNTQSLDDSGWNLGSEAEQELLKKLHNLGEPLEDYVKGNIFRGILTGLNEAFVINEETKNALIEEDPYSAEVIKPFLAGKDIRRYQPLPSVRYLIFFPKGFTNTKGNYPKKAWTWLENSYPAIAKHLKPHEQKAKNRYDQGDYWWELRACEYYKEFEKNKILWPGISLEVTAFTYDNNKFYGNDNNQLIISDEKYLLGILNSRVSKFQLQNICDKVQGGFYRLKIIYIKQLSIRKPRLEEQNTKKEIETLVASMLTLNIEKQQTTLPEKLEQIEQRIKYTDDKIDNLVYQLYGLNEDEIKIVEG